MFPNTLSFTIGGTAKVLNKINQDGYASEYLLRETDGEYTLRLRNTSYTRKGTAVKVDRHNAELTYTKFAVGDVPAMVRKAYMVFENDAGDALVNPRNHVLGFAGFFTSANIDELLAWGS